MQTKAVKYSSYQLEIIDQTLLPEKFKYIQIDTPEECFHAIETLKVRGAPLIGIVAAYSLAIHAYQLSKLSSAPDLLASLDKAVKYLESSRPTAVNLSWALNRMQLTYRSLDKKGDDDIHKALNKEAIKIHREDEKSCHQIGINGLSIISNKANVLTHCNTGSLATGGWGTALGVVYAAKEAGYDVHVYVDETRPLGQGARLTLWELMQNNVPCTLITDSMGPALMQQGKIDLVLFGADRIAQNGDVANKIGTYSLALAAKVHNIPCYAAAPVSTFDLSIPTGQKIPIEERDIKEILQFYKYDRKIRGLIRAFNPAFDVTPGDLLSGIITERGILGQPLNKSITKLLT